MLKNIKSLYFIKLIFIYIEEKQKLKLIKHNKSFQKNLNINIINYKLFTGKYIIYESNGIVREYKGYNDTLIFEGGYLNGKRNGKGKEYFNDKLIFEGGYLNGKRHGKGKEYDWINGKLIFEGQYLNGKRNGKGKEYNVINKLSFEGQYLNNKEWIGTKYKIIGEKDYIVNNKSNGSGNGFEYWAHDKIKYEGEYLKGKRHGKGKEYYFDGKLYFEGEYLNDLKWTGKGYDHSGNIIYELKDGKGLIKLYNQVNFILIYEGEYLNGKRNGKGKDYDFEGLLFYEGEYLDGKRNGKGKEYYQDGKLEFEGEYLYGYILKGKFFVKEKLEFEGEYLYNKKWNGKGYDENGNIIYELINGNGKVKEYDYKGKLRFEGEYLNGKMNGKGKEYKDGKLEFEGEYLNGQRIKKNKFGSCINI